MLHVCSEMDACAPGMHAVARAQVREWRGAQLAMHVRSQVQARKHVRACGLYILFFFSLFALDPAIERCNSCEPQNAPH